MSKQFLEWCKEKVDLSPEFQAGFDAGFAYAQSVRINPSRTCPCSKYYTCAQHRKVEKIVDSIPETKNNEEQKSRQIMDAWIAGNKSIEKSKNVHNNSHMCPADNLDQYCDKTGSEKQDPAGYANQKDFQTCNVMTEDDYKNAESV